MIVLGIALGGVPVAREVANALNAPLDLILLRRLLQGEDARSPRCAVNVGGNLILDDGIVLAERPATPVEYFLSDALTRFQEREQLCRRGRDAVRLDGKTVVVVDCGIHTGATMKSALRALSQVNPQKIVAAVPVTSIKGAAETSPMCDALIYLHKLAVFVNTGYWYRDFRRPGDSEVGDLLD